VGHFQAEAMIPMSRQSGLMESEIGIEVSKITKITPGARSGALALLVEIQGLRFETISWPAPSPMKSRWHSKQ
jgi:hypothetical protein